jgi:hypothetical protein
MRLSHTMKKRKMTAIVDIIDPKEDIIFQDTNVSG